MSAVALVMETSEDTSAKVLAEELPADDIPPTAFGAEDAFDGDDDVDLDAGSDAGDAGLDEPEPEGDDS